MSRKGVITVSKHRDRGKKGKPDKGDPTQTPGPQSSSGGESPQR